MSEFYNGPVAVPTFKGTPDDKTIMNWPENERHLPMLIHFDAMQGFIGQTDLWSGHARARAQNRFRVLIHRTDPAWVDGKPPTIQEFRNALLKALGEEE